MGKYKRLSMEEREEISRGLGQGLSFREISRVLGRAVSTVSREIGQGSMNRWSYRASRAQRRSVRQARRRKLGVRKLGENPQLWALVDSKLRRRWSPEQIARWLKREYPQEPGMQVAGETIYTYLYVLPRGQLKQRIKKTK